MNSRERVHCALKRQQPDRVPVMETIIDEGVAKAIIPSIKDVPEFMDRMDMDGISCRPAFLAVERARDGSYIDEWGVLYKGGLEEVAHPILGPIRTMDDVRCYDPPDPDTPHRLGDLPEVVSRYKGKRAIVFHHRDAFMWSAYLMGMDRLLESLVTDPEFAVAVMDKVFEANVQVARDAVRAGAEVVFIADDYAHNTGPLMSPRLLEQYVLPYLTRMVQAIHDEGAFCVKHTDGNIYPILEMLVSTGIDGLHPLEPVAGMELKTVKELVGDRVCLLGNIDCAHLLPHGTIQEVEEAVVKAIEDAGGGGGYIVTSSNSIHSSVNPENLVAMIEAVRCHGLYHG